MPVGSSVRRYPTRMKSPTVVSLIRSNFDCQLQCFGMETHKFRLAEFHVFRGLIRAHRRYYTAARRLFAHRVFHHLSAPKCSAYRAVLGVFVAARACFEVALRPSEVAARLTVYSDGTAGFQTTRADWQSALLPAAKSHYTAIEAF